MRPTRLLTLLAVLILALAVVGCSEDDDPVSPSAQAPTLPSADKLAFDFSFFDQGQGLEGAKADGEYDHFINAYVRVVVLDLAAHLVLAPPVAAFATALHTPPSLQDDGSWIWVYTHVDGLEEFQIRLHGLAVPDGDAVQWELRVTFDQVDNEVWFTGITHDDGETGLWTFYDAENDPDLAVAEIGWGREDGGEYLGLEVLAGDDLGDTLVFRDFGSRFAVEHLDVDAANLSSINWWADGHGNLTVPDYNGGQMACWDADLLNTVCE